MRRRDVMLQPTLPTPPEIEGYLKKLKRKTISISGNWNKRWFFVDPRRREFGYADSKSSAVRSSIYLDDITAVVQFDETHFQVESRTRNFFLWGESKASTACWVTSLEGYRKKVIEYEKAKIAYVAATGTAAGATNTIGATATTGNDDLQHSSTTLKESRQSVSSTALLSSKSKRDKGEASFSNQLVLKNEPRLASPLAKDDLRSRNGSSSRPPTSSDREKRSRDHHRDRKRGRDRNRHCKYERESSSDRDRSRDRVQASSGDRDRSARVPSSGRASIMQAWVDDL